MLKKFLHRAIRRFERENDYDAAYLHAMADNSPALAWRFYRFAQLAHYGKKTPPPLLALARIAAIRAEDCGPCLQLAIDFGLQAGLDATSLETAVRHPESLSGEARLIFDFATAVAKNSETVEALRAQIEERHGAEVLTELAMTIAYSRVYPAVKRAMGYAKSCQLIRFNFKKAS
ncbi:MAG: hypothetical protein U1F66_10040 [bacterium]